MAEINESIANITCGCGERFQVLNEEGTDWNERETAIQYYTHGADCQRVDVLLYYYNNMDGINALDKVPTELQTEINDARAVRGLEPATFVEEPVEPPVEEPPAE
jgi:hypothetical protein